METFDHARWSPPGRPLAQTSNGTKGKTVIAFVFLVAVIVSFALLAQAFGAETRDGFTPRQ